MAIANTPIGWLIYTSCKRHGVDARLIFLYFTGDDQMQGPCSEVEWTPYIDAAHAHLGIAKNARGVVTIFQDVRGL
jgi:hypothetical protein